MKRSSISTESDTATVRALNKQASLSSPTEDAHERIRTIVREQFHATGRRLYHPLPVPGFASDDLIVDRRGFEEKWLSIEARIVEQCGHDLHGKRILDVGANSGFFTVSLAKMGARVDAYEPDVAHSALARVALDCYPNLEIDWRNRTFDASEVAGRHYDFALVLSVFQWMADGGRRLGAACHELRVISEASSAMFFELGYNEGASCLRTDARDHLAYLQSFLTANTCYTQFELLKKTELYRYGGLSRIRHLWRRRFRYLLLCSR